MKKSLKSAELQQKISDRLWREYGIKTEVRISAAPENNIKVSFLNNSTNTSNQGLIAFVNFLETENIHRFSDRPGTGDDAVTLPTSVIQQLAGHIISAEEKEQKDIFIAPYESKTTTYSGFGSGGGSTFSPETKTNHRKTTVTASEMQHAQQNVEADVQGYCQWFKRQSQFSSFADAAFHVAKHSDGGMMITPLGKDGTWQPLGDEFVEYLKRRNIPYNSNVKGHNDYEAIYLPPKSVLQHSSALQPKPPTVNVSSSSISSSSSFMSSSSASSSSSSFYTGPSNMGSSTGRYLSGSTQTWRTLDNKPTGTVVSHRYNSGENSCTLLFRDQYDAQLFCTAFKSRYGRDLELKTQGFGTATQVRGSYGTGEIRFAVEMKADEVKLLLEERDAKKKGHVDDNKSLSHVLIESAEQQAVRTGYKKGECTISKGNLIHTHVEKFQSNGQISKDLYKVLEKGGENPLWKNRRDYWKKDTPRSAENILEAVLDPVRKELQGDRNIYERGIFSNTVVMGTT